MDELTLLLRSNMNLEEGDQREIFLRQFRRIHNYLQFPDQVVSPADIQDLNRFYLDALVFNKEDEDESYIETKLKESINEAFSIEDVLRLTYQAYTRICKVIGVTVEEAGFDYLQLMTESQMTF